MKTNDLSSARAELNIHDHEIDIRTMSPERLLAHFAPERGRRINASRLIRNLVWQALRDIRAGAEAPVKGNVRTFWYRWVRPVVDSIPESSDPPSASYRLTSAVLANLIEERRLFDYSDFGFNDENWRNRQVGLERPQVLLFCEKAGQIRLLSRLGERLGVSFVALGGVPGACTSEMTARQLQARLCGPGHDDPTTWPGPVHLVGLVDHDPAGARIALAFQRQLASFGLRQTTLTTVLHPQLYSAAERKAHRYHVGDRPGSADWLAAGGGIAGAPWGLALESLPRQRLEAAATAVILKVAPQAQPPVLPRQSVDVAGWLGVIGGPDGAALPVVLASQLPGALRARVAAGELVAVVEGGRVVGMFVPGLSSYSDVSGP